MKRRIVITGMGLFTAAGYSKKQIWERLEQSFFLPDEYERVKDKGIGSSCGYVLSNKYDVDQYIENKKLKRLAEFSKTLCIAGQQALTDAGISKNDKDYDPENVGSIVSTVHGPMNVTFDYLDDLILTGPKTARPIFFQQTVNNVACGQMAIENNLKGVSSTIVGASSIGYALALLEDGKSDICVVAGDEELHPYIYAAYGKRNMLSKNDGSGENSSPFSDKANGLVLGEGAGALILETYESAKKRNAHIYAEIASYSTVCDEKYYRTYDEFDENESTGFERAMSMTLDKADCKASEVGFVSVGANSYKSVDAVEKKALEKLFDYDSLGLVASKAIFGETLGAGEVLAAIAGLICMENKKVPGLNYIKDEYHATANVETCLINSMFTGGNINSMLLKKVTD